MAKDSEIIFPFGNRYFIGIVKFFDSTKGFGYIASNNYGMESQKRFSSNEQGFYIDNSSWENPISEKKAVAFRPAIQDTKLRAENVRVIDLSTDREMVMDYYEHDNFINYEEKVKRYSIGRYGRQHFEGYSYEKRKYNILMKSGICRYELLNEYAAKFSETNDFDFLLQRIDKIIVTIDGELAYNKQLRGTYGNKENEHAAWKKIFELLNEEQTFTILELHPSLQLFASDELLLGRIDTIDEKWGVSLVVKKALIALEESKKLQEIEKLVDLGLPNKSRKEIEDIRRLYCEKISHERLERVNNLIDEITLSTITEKVNELSDDSTEFIKHGTFLSNEFGHLSDNGKLQFTECLSNTYKEKIISLVRSIASLEWNDHQKREVKNFILNDNIVLAEKYSEPNSYFPVLF